MTGYSVSLRPGRYSSELSSLMLPRKVNPSLPAVIYAHGAGSNATQINDYKLQKGLTHFHGLAAHAGFVVLSGDWGGLQTFGNDASLTAMNLGWQWLQNSGLCSPERVILGGGSMGSATAHRFAFDHPEVVAAMNLWIPALDIEQARNNNPQALRELINTAWGLPAGSYEQLDGSRVPARGQILDRAATGVFNDIPTHLWYGGADTTTPADAVQRYIAARTNAVGHNVGAALGHSDAAIVAADHEFVVDFFKSVA